MHAISLPGDRQMRRGSILLWGWAMLLVVLLSAAPTGGAPRTTVIGSAFDPATVSVALSPKQSKPNSTATAAVKKREDAFSRSASATASLAWSAPVIRIVGAAQSVAPSWRHARAFPARSFNRAHAPRAPPAA